MKKIALLAALALAPALVAHAETGKNPGDGPNPYSECGIGAALFPSIPVGAVISNVIWDLGTTAITSALSSPQTCNARKVNTAQLILNTLASMEKDVANGGGTYTTALVSTMGCPVSSQQAMVAKMRESYAGVVAQPAYATESKTDRALGLYNTAKGAAAAVAPTCAAAL